MNAAEIVVSKMQRDGGFQVRKLLAESIGQTREPAKLHPHGEVASLHEASRDVIRVRVASSARPTRKHREPRSDGGAARL